MATTIGQRAATRLLEGVSDHLWDLRANLMSDIVERHGAVASLKWFASNMPAYEKILKAWGPLRTHLVAVTISAINGCPYCAYGHGYAFQLHYFDQTDQLFPLSEDAMRDLCGQSRDQVVDALGVALRGADLDAEVPWVQRTVERLDADHPLGSADQDDKRLDHLVKMFGWLNSCGIGAQTTPDEAHDPINKRSELRQRYAQARAQQLS